MMAAVRSRPGLIPVLVIALLLIVRVIAVFHHPFDSDEGQHLHMIYGWISGEWPYRDRFDNHTPLLYLLFLPLAALAGETPQIVLLARLAIFPVSAAMLGLIYLIARRLADRETARWTVAITLSLADWSMKSIEFRPDVLWAALWFLALWILVRRADRPSAIAFLLAGLALGAALCASIKTTFLAPALLAGWAGVWLASADFRAVYPRKKIVGFLLAAAVGFAIVPALVFGGFLLAGTSLERLKFCLFEANRAPFEAGRVALCLVLAPVAAAIAWTLVRRGNLASAIRGAIFLSVAADATALIGFSPELRKQTFLPVYPLLIFFACFIGFGVFRRWRPALVPIAGLLAVAGALTHLLIESPPWRDGLRAHRDLLGDALALTRPGDSLLDLKGETIFRRRPVFLVYQHATVRAIDEGRLAEPDPAQLSAKGTAAVIGGNPGFTPVMKAWLKDRYLRAGAGNLRVPGCNLTPTWQGARWAAQADVPVSGDYLLLSEGAPMKRIHLPAGAAELDFAGDPRPKVLFWEKAWDAGYKPGAVPRRTRGP